nr:uncharacterized protein si:dkey-19a16.5 [Danio rerio]|eukprot:XP_021325210.1 uncharacterized protein si:dkey-19a16.5 [Danio rerio]
MEGDSINLHTDINEMKINDDLLWKFGSENFLIAKISMEKQIFSTYDVLDGRFKGRLQLDHKTGSLTITDIRSEHAGDYQVHISGAKRSSKTVRVSVYAYLPAPVLIFNSSQCSSSVQYCSVLCSVVNVSAVSLSWYKGNSVLSSISVSDLSISLSLPLEVEYQDNNTYSCVINNTISNQTTHLDINTLCQTSCSVTDSVSLLVLVSAGSLLIVAAGLIVCIYRKCRKTAQEVGTEEDEITYIEPTIYQRKVKNLTCAEDTVEYAPIATRR